MYWAVAETLDVGHGLCMAAAADAACAIYKAFEKQSQRQFCS